MPEDSTKRLIRYLNDAYASEVGSIKGIESLIAETTDTDLKTALTSHLTETQGHADLLTTRILALGGDKSEPKAIIDQIIALGSSVVNVFHDKEDKQAQDLIKSVSLEAFEIATYTALNTYASAIGDDVTADAAQSILDEEKAAYTKLLALVPQVSLYAVDKVAVAA